jgi:hypothetical protein
MIGARLLFGGLAPIDVMGRCLSCGCGVVPASALDDLGRCDDCRPVAIEVLGRPRYARPTVSPPSVPLEQCQRCRYGFPVADVVDGLCPGCAPRPWYTAAGPAQARERLSRARRALRARR